MYIDRVPNDSTSLVTATSMPAMAEAISITVTTPMMTPITVSAERNLFARRVFRAIQRFSRMSERKNLMINLLGPGSHSQLRFCPQGFNWIQPRRLPGGEQSG